VPVGDRSILQTNQTNLAPHWRCVPESPPTALAGLDGPVGFCIAALFELPLQVGTQFHAALYDLASGFMGETGFMEIIGVLWDSRGQL
jgi:hypothetical protein